MSEHSGIAPQRSAPKKVLRDLRPLRGRRLRYRGSKKDWDSFAIFSDDHGDSFYLVPANFGRTPDTVLEIVPKGASVLLAGMITTEQMAITQADVDQTTLVELIVRAFSTRYPDEMDLDDFHQAEVGLPDGQILGKVRHLLGDYDYPCLVSGQTS